MNLKTMTAVALVGVQMFFFGAPCLARAQENKTQYPSMAPLDEYLMDHEAEIVLARSAGPASISRDAKILVLGRHGYETAVEGRNGFVCMADRGWMLPFDKPDFWNPKVRLPLCMNSTGARFHLPLAFKTADWALSGVTKDKMSTYLKIAYDSHELPLPEPGSMCYMMSKQQYFGDKEGNAGDSHLMFWFPEAERMDWGADTDDSPVNVHQYSPQPITEFTISISKWSDGTSVAISQPSGLLPGASSALEQSPFNGTWRANNGSMEYHGSNKYSLQNGFWRCGTCVPRIAIKADGHEYRINSSLYYGAAYADTESVREVNDHSIKIIDKVGWKVVGVNKFSTSVDGKTLTTDWKNGKESGKFDSERVGSAPAGGNKVSGEWRPVKTNTSEGEITSTYKVTADGLVMTDPTGDSYAAKFDGREYPFKGDPGITGVSLKKIDENTIEETDTRKGKVITVSRMTVDRDGKTMRVTVEDKLRKATITWTASKL
jgi:hypothetical protein